MELDEMWHFVGKKNESDGYGSLFVVLQKESLPLQWVVVERKPGGNFGKKSKI